MRFANIRVFSQEELEKAEKLVIKKSRSSTTKSSKEIIPLLLSLNDADLRIRFKNDTLNTKTKISVDTETTGLRVWFDDEPWMVSMADRDGGSWACLWPVDPYTRRVKLIKSVEYYYLKKIVEDESITKEYFNAWYDIRNLAKIGIVHRGPIEEVALKARVANTDEFSYKLKDLSYRKCGLPNDDETELKKWIHKLQKLGRKYGLEVFNSNDTTNSEAKKDTAAPDYWLAMYAHCFPEISKEDAELIKQLAEEYCRKDTLRTSVLSAYYDERFALDDQRAKTYQFEQELMYVVDSMETRGIRTFRDVAERERENCRLRAEELLKELREMSGNPELNPNSSAHVAAYLFTKAPKGLGLPPTERTPTGQCKTGQKEIGQFAYIPWVAKLFEYKACEKAISLFFDKYIDNLQPEKDYEIIHPQIHQNRTRTFRFSMSNPNLQQAANPESSAGANVIQVRNAFGPRPGYIWALLDYSAQEFRIMGAAMDIKAIKDAVKNGEDIPTVLGNKTWGGKNNRTALLQVVDSMELEKEHPSSKAIQEFWKEHDFQPGKFKSEAEKLIYADAILRDTANYDIVKFEKLFGKKTVRTRTKMCMYGKAYGAGANGVMSLLRCNEQEARQWLRELDNSFPEMRRVGNQWMQQASDKGYIVNAYGRKIDVPSEKPYVAVNYMIQSSAADMVKVSMKRIHKWFEEIRDRVEAYILLTVHDELVFEIKAEHSYKWLWKGIKDRMEDHREFLDIPIECGVSKVVKAWHEETSMDHIFLS